MLNKLGPRRYRGLKKSKIFIRDNTSEVIIGTPYVPLGHALGVQRQQKLTNKERESILTYLLTYLLANTAGTFDLQEVKM